MAPYRSRLRSYGIRNGLSTDNDRGLAAVMIDHPMTTGAAEELAILLVAPYEDMMTNS